jgi:hypothetical protein
MERVPYWTYTSENQHTFKGPTIYLEGGGGYGFLFRSEFLFRTTRVIDGQTKYLRHCNFRVIDGQTKYLRHSNLRVIDGQAEYLRTIHVRVNYESDNLIIHYDGIDILNEIK